MDYQDWIERERRYRIQLLKDWPEARDHGIFRVCQACDEICLCAEEVCPNCGGKEITRVNLGIERGLDGTKIRCKLRYEALFATDGSKTG